MMSFVFAFLVAAQVSCSDDDSQTGDPAGTVSVNMMNENNGKTLLGYSDIYIDGAQNFVTGGECEMFVVGKSNGLGGVSVRALDTSAAQAAVRPGYGYVAVKSRAMTTFPSGKKALPIGRTDVNYMKFYVVSELARDDDRIGAAVRYVTVQPESYGLPEFDTTVLDVNYSVYDGRELYVTLPSAECEYDFNDEYSQFSCTKRGNKLIFEVPSYQESHEGSFALWIRMRESYTRVFVKLHYTL